MKSLVPIYTANIKLSIIRTHQNKRIPDVELSEAEVSGVVVKGFSIKDIIKRSGPSIITRFAKGLKLKPNQEVRIKSVHLIMRHGYGVNER